MFNWGKRENSVLRAKNDELIKDINDLDEERSKMDREIRSLKRELDKLKSKKRIEEEEIKHMVKILDEKREIEFQKKEIQIQKNADDKVMSVKNDFQSRIQSQLAVQITESKAMYEKLLERLPDVNVMLRNQSSVSSKKKG